VHTFTEVTNFGGGFVGVLNGALEPTPECADPTQLVFLPYGGSDRLTELGWRLHQFQCCIHPWMRAAVCVN
jgi:hypothetical protein